MPARKDECELPHNGTGRSCDNLLGNSFPFGETVAKLSDIDAYDLVDALGDERNALVNSARDQGRRPTDAERMTICTLQALERALKAAADKGRARENSTR